jgi:hypothetical protein
LSSTLNFLKTLASCGKITNTHLRPFIHGQAGNVDVVEKHFSAIGFHQAYYLVKRGGFTGAIRTEQTNNFTLTNVKGYIVYNRTAAVNFYKIVGLNG